MKILVYHKNIPADSKAMDIALRHATAFDASIVVLGVVDTKNSTPREVIDAAKERVEKAAASVAQAHGVSCESKLIQTALPLGEAVVQFTQNNDIDELVMGLKKRSKLGKLIFGSNTQYIILEAPCHVITVKDE